MKLYKILRKIHIPLKFVYILHQRVRTYILYRRLSRQDAVERNNMLLI